MDELKPSNDVLSEYAHAGGIHGIAAKELLGLLTQTDCYSPWAVVAALMRENGSPPNLKTWWQTLEVAEKIFNTQDAPEPESALSALTEQQPRHLLTLAMLLLADFYKSAEPPLPECIRGAFGIFMNRLQFNRLVNQAAAGNEAETNALGLDKAKFIYAQVGIRSIQSAKAKAPRPRKHPTLASEFKKAMRGPKREGKTLKAFMASVANENIPGLRARTPTNRDSPGYELYSDAIAQVTVDLNDEKQVWKLRSFGTIESWWKAI